jgi:hypothetical protein
MSSFKALLALKEVFKGGGPSRCYVKQPSAPIGNALTPTLSRKRERGKSKEPLTPAVSRKRERGGE